THTLHNVVKIISAQTEDSLNIVADVYGPIVEAGLYRASSIKVAEAAKVIENTQRDVNIALMNELAIIFNKLSISTTEVLDAASTKWNFLKFSPGLVGGHCIGVDPYYLTYKAELVGYHPQVILAGRRINDGMGEFVVSSLVKQMILKGGAIQGKTVTIMGITFKEDVPDLRNSKAIDVIDELKEFGVKVQVTDPLADKAEALSDYGIDLIDFTELEPADAIVIAVPHLYYRALGWPGILNKMKQESGIVFDIKGILPTNDKPSYVSLWRL
ncbi:MAG: nucleotide sugar dehydrogenase, partial [Paenibacillaceae bacterium]|nr:nucleotide sugar dehydrogenase [Paenibacillaceae bacterium]